MARTPESGRDFFAGLLEALVEVMGSAKGYLRDHGPRVAVLSARIGEAVGLDDREVSRLIFAAVLSDMGMIGLVEEAWENPRPELSPESRARVQEHPARSEERVVAIPHLEGLAPLIRHHHEWWDGSGYPDGLRGDEIPVGARILRLADTVAALGQDRPHRGALSPAEIAEVVAGGEGVEFGPEVVAAYTELHRLNELPAFEPAAFRHAVTRAAEKLLPEEVSPLSSDQLLGILANLIDAKDPYTAGHSRRVAGLSVEVAGILGLQEELESTLWAGGYLHDLGKLRVPLRILAKKERLTDREVHRIQQHAADGAAILEQIPTLRHLTTSARYHHERWDGSGYPEGLRGEQIPLVAQIMAVCDAYDAMTSTRAYRRALSHGKALEEIHRSVGSHFSPRAADAFLALDEEVFLGLEAAEKKRDPSQGGGAPPFLARRGTARRLARRAPTGV